MAHRSASHAHHKLSDAWTRRAFIPLEHLFRTDTPLEHVTQASGNFLHLACPVEEHFIVPKCEACNACRRKACHSDTFVIAVDGACPGNGKKDLVFSAAGVYVGPGNPANKSYTLTDRGATNQRAELRACILGSETAQDLFPIDRAEGAISVLVIKTDSAYAYKGITSYMDKWKLNGWKTAAKKGVANRDSWETLDSSTQELERRGIEVLFWWVPREYNTEADSLANEGYAFVKTHKMEDLLASMCNGELELEEKFQLGKRALEGLVENLR